MEFKLPELSYKLFDLEPYISRETLEYHYLKHHFTYIKNLNNLIIWTEYEDMNLEEIIKNSEWIIFNNAAQVWNHNFYFNCLTSMVWLKPKWSLCNMIERDFWSFEKFVEKFTMLAVTNFWSWWTWLVLNSDKKLEIISTSNAHTPLITNYKPLLTIDIWEHAYYIDYRNIRADYIKAFFEVVNWDFVTENLNFY